MAIDGHKRGRWRLQTCIYLIVYFIWIPGCRIDAEASSLKKKLDEMTASQKCYGFHDKDPEGPTPETIEVSLVILKVLVINIMMTQTASYKLLSDYWQDC